MSSAAVNGMRVGSFRSVVLALAATGALVLLALVSRSSLGQTVPIEAEVVALRLYSGATVQPVHADLTHLIVVATHAVFRGRGRGGGGGGGGGGRRTEPGLAAEEVLDEQRWALEPYQVGHVATFVEHIRTGMRLVDEDPTALLILSGGKTRPAAGPRSEAQSYWEIAEQLGWPSPGALARATTEEFARDSFENLLFSICRFREVTGAYPERVTVVSLPHKRERFADVHRAAIRFPTAAFDYVGVGPAANEAALAFEHRLRTEDFAADPYGCRGDLARKRALRNPGRRTAPYLLSCPELRGLLLCCWSSIYSGTLPWDP